MDFASHTLDIELLRHDRDRFILQCQRTIAIIVRFHIQKGMFPASEFDDIVQSVNEELIRRLDGVAKNFNGSVMLSTYMNVVIRNICLRIHERRQRTPVTEPMTEDGMDERADAMHPILLQDEQQRFATALRLFGRRRSKVVFCLRVYFRMPITAQDVHRVFDRVGIQHRNTLAEQLQTAQNDTKELDTFNAVAAVMNIQEQNNTTGSSLRRWTLDHLARTIALMNGEPPVRSHTKETIKLLLEEVTP